MIEAGQVSCVIPYAGSHIYPGAKRHLFEAIDSALLQGFGEIILSYDGPESSPLEGHPKIEMIRIIRQNQRVGPAKARNAGIQSVTQPWVVLLDQDDVLGDGYLKGMLRWVNEGRLRCAAATLFYIGENRHRIGSLVSRHPDFFLPSGFFSETTLIAEAGYFPDTPSEDLFFFLEIRKRVKLTTNPDARVLYRIHPSASAGNMVAAWALLKFLPEYEAGTYSLEKINALAKEYLSEGKIPAGMESRFTDSDFPHARFQARNAYASWLNRDFIGLVRHGSKLLVHTPKLARMAMFKWRHKRSA